MSTIVRAKTRISAVIPSLMEAAVEVVAKRRGLTHTKAKNKITIKGDGSGSYDRTNFQWEEDGKKFQANYDDMHGKTAISIVNEVQGQYTTLLVSAIAAEEGFNLVSCERQENGSFLLNMDR